MGLRKWLNLLRVTLINLKNNITSSWVHIPYTFKHYIAFLKLEKKLIGYYKYKFHDLDKLLMYLFIPFLGTAKIKQIHSRNNSHHIKRYKTPGQCNYEEAIIDWECARFTKLDKPETARAITERKLLGKTHYENLIKVLDKFNL